MKVRAVTAYCAVFIFKNRHTHKASWYASSKVPYWMWQWIEENHRQFFIPRGFAHGFSVLSPEVIFQYKCDNFYAPQSEGALAWDDPDLDINWRIPSDKIILSEKDKHHPRLKDAEWLFDYSENLYQ